LNCKIYFLKCRFFLTIKKGSPEACRRVGRKQHCPVHRLILAAVKRIKITATSTWQIRHHHISHQPFLQPSAILHADPATANQTSSHQPSAILHADPATANQTSSHQPSAISSCRSSYSKSDITTSAISDSPLGGQGVYPHLQTGRRWQCNPVAGVCQQPRLQISFKHNNVITALVGYQ